MSDRSAIEWTDATWNPLRGTIGRHHCVRISEGCKNCYAARDNHRFKGPDYVVGADTPRLDENALLQPLRWKRPRRIFVCSMTDLFLDAHTDEMIDRVFAVMADASQHTFQVLTKRADRMRRYVSPDNPRYTARKVFDLTRGPAGKFDCDIYWPLENVQLGVSVENQPAAAKRIWQLMDTNAAVRFLSLEPLLAPVSLTALNVLDQESGSWPEVRVNSLTGYVRGPDEILPGKISWVIVGGESGARARGFDLAWARSIKEECRSANVPLFVKQFGGRPMVANDEDDRLWPGYTVPFAASYAPRFQGEVAPLEGLGAKGGDMELWPEDLRIREFPAEVGA